MLEFKHHNLFQLQEGETADICWEVVEKPPYPAKVVVSNHISCLQLIISILGDFTKTLVSLSELFSKITSKCFIAF